MEEVTQETVETPQESTAPVEAPQETTETPVEASTEETPYEPNYKYNIKDQEFEMDEWSRPLIKDKDTEAKFRDLYTSSRALDTVKESRDRLQSEYEQVNGSYKELTDSLDILRGHVKNNDYQSFFQALGIETKTVQNWMLQHLQAEQMPPEQQQQYNQHLDAVRRATELERENQHLTAQQEQFAVQQREHELSQALQEPQVNQLMRDYDARQGRVGAFREEVLTYALGKYNATGEDVSAQDAVMAIAGFMGVNNQVGAQTPQAQPQVVAPQNNPTIPNIQGRNTSPVRKAPKSIEEMKEMYEQRFGSD